MIEVAAVVTRSAGAEERVLTKTIRLQQCIEQALACNPDLKIERLNPQIEQWSIAQERSAFEPVIGGGTVRVTTNRWTRKSESRQGWRI